MNILYMLNSSDFLEYITVHIAIAIVVLYYTYWYC